MGGKVVFWGKKTAPLGVLGGGGFVGAGGLAGRLRLAWAWRVEIFGMAGRSRRFAFGGKYVKVSLYFGMWTRSLKSKSEIETVDV